MLDAHRLFMNIKRGVDRFLFLGVHSMRAAATFAVQREMASKLLGMAQGLAIAGVSQEG